MPIPTPLPPWILMDALQDPVHNTSGRLLAARPAKSHKYQERACINPSTETAATVAATDDGSASGA